jgi:hypothetical protein
MPALGLLVTALYVGIAVAALTALILAASQIAPRPWLPLALTFIVCLVFFRVPAVTVLHPLIHLFWRFHEFGGSDIALTWWASAVYLTAEFGLAFAMGRSVLLRAEL